MAPNVLTTLLDSLNQGLSTAIAFLPNIIVGLIILLIGVVIAAFIKQLVIKLFQTIQLDIYLKKYNIPSKEKGIGWTEILAEIVRWFIIILFLIPTADVWQLPQFALLLNTFLFYLPNVFVAAIIAVVGLAFARLAAQVVAASTKSFSKDVSRIVTSTVRVSITIFI